MKKIKFPFQSIGNNQFKFEKQARERLFWFLKENSKNRAAGPRGSAGPTRAGS